MSLRGLPDLGAPVFLDGALAGYAGFEDPALVLVPPRRLRLARREDGRYAFTMERFRPRNAVWPAPYGVVTLGVEAERPEDEVLAAARAADPNARVVPATLATGTLRLAGMTHAADLAWDGIGTCTWSERLTPEEITTLRGAVQGAFPEIRADAVVEVMGVPARHDARVTLDPQALSTALIALHTARGRDLARADVLGWLRTEVVPGVGAGVLVEVRAAGTPPAEEQLAEALADRIRSRWRGWVPPVAEAPGRWTWDLAEPTVTWREHLLTLPLFDAFIEIAAHLDEHEPPGVDLEPVPTGWRTVTVLANLPGDQSGLAGAGVDITAPPRPPARPQAVTATVELAADRPTGTATLRLAPGEEPDFVRQTWVVVADSQGVREVRGAEVPVHGERFTLRPVDFPLRYLRVDAEQALLDLASVRLGLRRTDGKPFLGQDEFTVERPRADLPLPADADVEARVRITSPADASLDLGPFATTDPLWLGRHLLPSWGPHGIQVGGGHGDLVAVALRPETSDGDGEIVTLTRAHPVRTWTWFADDPFRGGYQFRIVPAGTAPGPWSAVRRYDEQLDVTEVPA
ncbi:MAG: hypothetical protein J7518_15780 [Nocardioidaceae bacterium]|nr:hypothetical protein [Nocardioidaceae bacterium]